jgi:hypothetical protein
MGIGAAYDHDEITMRCLTDGIHGRMRVAAGYLYPATIMKGYGQISLIVTIRIFLLEED